jgi:hypothetical protein
MQPSGIAGQRGNLRDNGVVGAGAPLLARFVGKIVLDVLPAALATVIGGFLFTQYQFGHAGQHPALEQVQPASAEMMALVRDEHTMILDYLKAQTAAEKSRLAADDADTARAADIKVADARAPDTKPAADASARRVAAVSGAKPAAPHNKVAAAVAPTAHAPLVIAQAGPAPAVVPASDVTPDDRLARDPDSLLAKTLDLKDHVVAATRHAVSVIGDVFTTVGERIIPPAPVGPRQFAS